MTDHRAQTYEAAEARLRLPMLLLAVATVPLLAISLSQEHLSRGARSNLDTIDWGIWAAFLLEYLVLLVLSPSKRRFFRTHLLELALVVLPFLRPLRIVRSGRALTALRVARMGVAGGAGAKMARKHLIASTANAAAVAAVVFTVVIAVSVLDVEQHAPGSNIRTLPDALWWSATTVTTVGYGDRFPVTGAGRAMAVVLMLFGIALLGVITAALASWFVNATSAAESEDEIAALRADVRRLTDIVERGFSASRIE